MLVEVFHFMNVETNRRHQIILRTGSPFDLHTRFHLLLSRSHSVSLYFFWDALHDDKRHDVWEISKSSD